MNALKDLWNDFSQDAVLTLKNNANTFTLFAVALVLLGGAKIVDNTSQWWLVLVAGAAFALVLFVYMNSKAVIKALLSTVGIVFLGSFAYTSSFYADVTGSLSLTWMLSLYSLFAINLTLSYILKSAQSRWGTSFISTILSFASTYVAIGFGVPIMWAILVGFLIGLAAFFFMYRFGFKTRYNHSKMPQSAMNDELKERLEATFSKNGWETRVLNKGKEASILVWNDKRAYSIYPIDMKQQFTNIAKKRGFKLGYMTKNINPWLLDTLHDQTPLWRARGAEVTLVLLDVNTANGSEPKVIGLSLPDTQKKVPVGIISGKIKNLPSQIDQLLEPMVGTLKTRHIKNLREIGTSSELNRESE